jgi:hypothetical protein
MTNQSRGIETMLVITDLPDIMEKRENWPIAAASMRRWFAKPANTMSMDVKTGKTPMDMLPGNLLETEILTMDWALGFSRVQIAYNTLITEKWNNPAAIGQMGVRVRAAIAAGAGANVKPGKPWRFGNLAAATPAVDRMSQVNFIVVGDLRDPLDDFYGAVGKGTLNVAVAGSVTSLPGGKLSLVVDTLGVYLRDTYDFVGQQKLGVWTEKGIDRSTLDEAVNYYISQYPPIAIEPPDPKTAPKDDPDKRYSVSNADFNRYRDKFSLGADFVSVSDVRTVKLPSPQTFELA